MTLVLTVLQIVAPVGLLALVGFLWVKAGFEYRIEFITRLCMTLSVPALVFTALMKTDIDPAALTSVSLAAAMAYGVLTLLLWGVTTVLHLDRRTDIEPVQRGFEIDDPMHLGLEKLPPPKHQERSD